MFSGQLWREQVTNLLETSAISIPVLSKDYVGSSNCMNELKKMIDLKDQKGLVVLPVKVQAEELVLPDPISSINYASL